jgi:PhzF family phenazine biosynthesis protein
MPVPIIQVDAFASGPFTGNPAAVCLLEHPATEDWMQRVAAEMNLSETAFVVPEGEHFGLRWFTPAVEVDLCGHATLATAHALWSEGRLDRDQEARFNTRSGLLTASCRGKTIELDFPARRQTPLEAPPEIVKALGAHPLYSARDCDDLLLLLADEATVRTLEPDISRLKRLQVRGVIVTAAASSPDFDFVSRFFAPGVGIDEDPVTGSAHCSLGPFWQTRLGKDELRAFQASRRGGVVQVRVAGDRVKLGGQAVTVLRGELVV